MADDLIFYTNPMSRGRIARWMLEEIGEPYETRLVDWRNKPADLIEANPIGKVPTIVHRGHVVSEAAAICAYLAEAFADKGLAPTDDERADYHRWMFYAAGPMEAAMTDKALGVTVPPERRAMVGYGSFEEAIETFRYGVGRHPYIAGDRFTAADVYVGSAVAWFTQFGMLPKAAPFSDYLDRLTARPAYRRAREIDDALIEQA